MKETTNPNIELKSTSKESHDILRAEQKKCQNMKCELPMKNP